ncbi:uncharacterized protein LOC141849697 [Brevipalpus obovatus]|uniref:uncharacterized protein LOC141849697 n=1 Tax=Brevipalpus obovatus TaxID=246614 RepID=UPI003D9EA87E
MRSTIPIIVVLLNIISSCVVLAKDRYPDAIHLSNGALKFIITTYIDDLLSRHSPDDGLKQRLQKMSDHVVNHPALLQKRVFFGSETPPQSPEEEPSPLAYRSYRKRFSAPTQIRKDDDPQYPSDEICKTQRQWELINETYSYKGDEVEVIQDDERKQWIYTYRCVPLQDKSCLGIDSSFKSECAERDGWFRVYYRKISTGEKEWGPVAAPHHCACKIHPKIEQPLIVPETQTPSPAELQELPRK